MSHRHRAEPHCQGVLLSGGVRRLVCSVCHFARLRGSARCGTLRLPASFRGSVCVCKKPNTLLYEQASREHCIAAERSFVIGDSPEDMSAAQRLEACGCLVRTGWAADPRTEAKDALLAHCIADSIHEAVDWVLSADEIR